jgi:hypothetical protein
MVCATLTFTIDSDEFRVLFICTFTAIPSFPSVYALTLTFKPNSVITNG